jgi:hypothetical protein
MIQELHEADSAETVQFCNTFCEAVFGGGIPVLVSVLLHLSKIRSDNHHENITSQFCNNKCNDMLIKLIPVNSAVIMLSTLVECVIS